MLPIGPEQRPSGTAVKIVFHLAGRSNDMRALFQRFPDVSFVTTRSVADVAQEIGDADALVAWSADYTPAIAAVCKERCRRLRWIQFATSGIDTALKNGGFPPGVTVTNCAGLRAANLAEHAFALLFFLARRMRRMEEARRHRLWIRQEIHPEIRSLQATTLTILGMGAVGHALARRAKAFDMRVLAVSRAYRADATVDAVYSRDNALAAFAEADVIAVCMPSTPETVGFIDRRKLAAMKKTAFLINIARGDIVVEQDLVEACTAGGIAGAGLDVAFEEPPAADSPLWRLENVVLTPHVGGSGNDETQVLAEMVAENLELFLAARPLLRRVAY
jgi:phosphoglycerate dehydrogenase-like enzyme